MGLFNRIQLEEFTKASIKTAFEFPLEERLAQVDANSDISKEERGAITSELPSFIVALNMMSLVILGTTGKIKRFKGDTTEKISETVAFGYTITIPEYFKHFNKMDESSAVEAAELTMEVATSYLSLVDEDKEYDNSDDIFFALCNGFTDKITSTKSTQDAHVVIFDFSRQLYRNIESAMHRITIS